MRSRLVNFASDMQGLAFEWGETDCVALAFRALDAVHGAPHLVEFVSWSDRESALGVIQDCDRARTPKALGFEEVPRAFAQAGDVLISWPRRPTDFICAHILINTRWVLSSAVDERVGLMRAAELEGYDLMAYRYACQR